MTLPAQGAEISVNDVVVEGQYNLGDPADPGDDWSLEWLEQDVESQWVDPNEASGSAPYALGELWGATYS